MIIHSFAGFVDIGSCVLHVVHNAFGKGLEKYGKEVDQLCLDLHAIFKHSSARREDCQQLQFDMGVELHTFQQHTEVCWLSIGPVISYYGTVGCYMPVNQRSEKE